MRYQNVAPISQIKEALKILGKRWDGRWSGTELHYREGAQDYIDVIFAPREFEESSHRFFSITRECAELLIKNGYVSGVKRFGHIDANVLMINPSGVATLAAVIDQEIAEARKQLKVGEHGWSANYTSMGKHRLKNLDDLNPVEGWLFTNPSGDYFLVLEDARVKTIHSLDDVEKCV